MFTFTSHAFLDFTRPSKVNISYILEYFIKFMFYCVFYTFCGPVNLKRKSSNIKTGYYWRIEVVTARVIRHLFARVPDAWCPSLFGGIGGDSGQGRPRQMGVWPEMWNGFRWFFNFSSEAFAR